MISFVVLGQAQTAGSKQAFPFQKRDGKLGVRVTDDNPRSRDWKQQVAWEAKRAYRGKLLEGPLAVRITFNRVRPKGHFRSDGSLSKTGVETPFPHTRPDLLKLARAAEDACTGVIWRDDALIVTEILTKVWTDSASMVMTVYAPIRAKFNKELVDTIVESLYHVAATSPANMVSEGGLPADQRWWKAIEDAYKQGAEDYLDGLHD